jgi:hypothetical protein
VASAKDKRRLPLITRDGDRALGTVRVTPRGLALLERLGREGQDQRSLAKALGISAKTLLEARKRQPEVEEALDRGHAGLSDELTHLLLTLARKGNVVAAIFLAKARCGWREGDAPEARANIVIQLPDANSPEQYLKIIGAGVAQSSIPSPSSGERGPST